ncbi:MAG: hypothetical protein R3D05_01300 [Dongiaceae bacterium]
MPSEQQTSSNRSEAPVGDGLAARTHRKKRSPKHKVRRFLRKFLGSSRTGDRALRERPGENAVFDRLWRVAAAASDYPRKLSIHQSNVLLFQMGKVASLALEATLIDLGINCFHCHFLRHDKEQSRLARLFRDEPNLWLAGTELKMLMRHTALNMLVRWYRANQVTPERKLKVITLTRDPATWYVSQLLQHVGHDASRLLGWYREFGGGDAPSDDVGEAVGALFRRLAKLIVATNPSTDPEAARESGQAMMLAMEPPQPYIAYNLERALIPLNWFDQEFTPLFGIDIRTVPELAERGLAQRDAAFADILFVRFEDLATHMESIARFVGLPPFELPQRNVTAGKPHAHQILQAARSFWATELGASFQRELRASAYGRACGYDRMM